MTGNKDVTAVFGKIAHATTTMSYSGATSGAYSDTVILKARLLSNGLPQVGKQVNFKIGTLVVGAASTDSNGYSSLTIKLTQTVGAYVLEARFAGDSGLQGAYVQVNFNIAKENVDPAYTGDTIVQRTDSGIDLRATIYEDMDGSFGDMTQMQVYFQIWPGAITPTPWKSIGPINVQLTDTLGVGVATATTPLTGFTDGAYTMVVNLVGGSNYVSSKSPAVSVTICSAVSGTSSVGAGIINDGGHPGVFGFVVSFDKNNKPVGDFLYIYFDGTWDYIVVGTSVTGLAFSGNHVFFEGWCSVQRFNPDTGQVINEVGKFKYRVDAWDNLFLDNFQVQILDEYGINYHMAGGSGSQGQVLGVVSIIRKK